MNKQNWIDPDRPMAVIVKILQIEPIDGADNIELASVLGWKCVVQKNIFKVDDLCIYFSIDSILDQNNEKTAFFGPKPLKTKKIRGVLSQGLIGHIDWLPQNIPYEEGTDVTTIMNVKKYVNNEELSVYKDDSVKIRFPSYVPKTDEERVQNCGKILKELVGRNVVVTRKEDGTSTTFIFKDGVFSTFGRNFCIDPNDKSAYYNIVKKQFDVENRMINLGKNIAIQGETVGPKIGANRLKLEKYDFRVFNIYDIDNACYMVWKDVEQICEKLELNTVPVVYQGVFREQDSNRTYLLKKANLMQYSDPLPIKTDELISQQVIDAPLPVYDKKNKLTYPCEGFVVKTDDGKDFPWHSFKVISNEYLLYYGL